MTDTANLGLPFIDASQAQKHVTHNEALRILDAAIQVSVLDRTRTAPPSSPVDGERLVVATGATGAWAGQDNAIATWQDGAWAFLPPKTGWCTWSVADDMLFVFDGSVWRDFRSLPTALDNALQVGINTVASSPNLLSVKSNDALFAAIDAADGGTGDMRIQVSKEDSVDTASVVFSDNFSGRAEFGLIGSDTFKLKVSSDGTAWSEAFNIDPASGNLTLPRGVALTGVVSPVQISADQNDYSPAGLAAASVLQISADAAHNVSGLAGGAEGRCIVIVNVGSYPVTLLNESASSTAINRFAPGGNLVIAAKQAAILRYDGTAARWQAIAGGALNATSNLSDLASASAARSNLGLSFATRMITGADTIVTSDLGKTLLVNSSSAFTLAVTAAATLGDGFWCNVRNTGTALVTIDPNSSETIDGKSMLTIGLKEAMRISCDGTSLSSDSSNGRLVELARATNPAAATVDFNFASGFPADFDEFEVHLIDVQPAANDAYLGMQVKTTASLTVQASGYVYSGRIQGATAGADIGSTADGVSGLIALCRPGSGNGIGNAAASKLGGLIAFSTPNSANVKQAIFGGAYVRSDGVGISVNVTGYWSASSAAWTGLRFLMSSGNVANGSIVLYGRRK